jgi:hypothetical protein
LVGKARIIALDSPQFSSTSFSRKKNFIATIEKTIEQLESSNRRMKAALTDVVQTHFNKGASRPETTGVVVPGVTPTASPAIVPKIVSTIHVPSLAPAIPRSSTQDTAESVVEKTSAAVVRDVSPTGTASIPLALKRVRHGFSLAP